MTKREEKIKNYLNEYKNKADEFSKDRMCTACGGKIKIQKCYKILRCTKRNCRRCYTIFNNKVINESHLKIGETLQVLNYIIKGASSKLIQSQTGVVKNTVSKIRKNLKTSLRKMFWRKNPKIGGEKIVVEADESKFGKRKYNRGHYVEGVWVLGIVERTSARKILFFILKNRKKTTMDWIFKKSVELNSVVYTDMHRGYLGLSTLGFSHFSVNHSLYFTDPITGVNTNTIEGNWSALKTFIPKRYRTKKWIGLFLVIYMIKRNFNDNVFDFFIKNMS